MGRGLGDTVSETLRSIDVFQGVPRELAEDDGADWRGRIFFMLLGYALIALLSVTEIASFASSTWTTDTIVSSQMDMAISLQFVFTVPNVPCKYLKLGARDAFGMSGTPLQDRSTVHLRPLDQYGNQITEGTYIKDDEALGYWTDANFQFKADKTREGSMTSGEFVRKNFSEAISLHDFTLVYFHADWCEHSRAFDPVWSQLLGEVNKVQKVTLLKLNCATYSDTCRGLNIKSFPTLRMHTRNGVFASYQGHAHDVTGIKGFIGDFINDPVQEQAVEWNGCQVDGAVNIPRVQGNFHLTVGYSETDSPNPDLVNLSMLVDHLSFNDATANWRTIDRLYTLMYEGVPSSVTDHLMPIDGKEFIVDAADTVPEHFLKVVQTKIGAKKEFYQITHSAKTGRAPDSSMVRSVPLARFSYDFSPLSVVLQRQSKPWYDFLTSFIAIVGGSFAIVQMCGGTADKIYLARKASKDPCKPNACSN
jgi:thiol-disulfide isomerase/thioredoxin